MQERVYQPSRIGQPFFSNPKVTIRKNAQSPILSYGGIVLARDLIERLDVAKRIDESVALLKMHSPYHESDHVLTLLYNFLTGGETLLDLERLQGDEGFRRLIGAQSIPDPTTAGDFLVRFHDFAIDVFQGVCETIQDLSFSLLDGTRKKVGTIESDSTILEVYGRKKEGADYCYDNRWSYSCLLFTLSETGDLLHTDLRSGNTYSSVGAKEQLPKIIERLEGQFGRLRYRADSAFYDKDIVWTCESKGVEFFITADQTKPLMAAVMGIPEQEWKRFKSKEKSGQKGAKRRKKRKDLKRKISVERKPDTELKGRSQVASFQYTPSGWGKPFRFIVKRTEILDKDNNQLYLDEGMCKYLYHVIVTNSAESDAHAMRIGQQRGNQENLIKDFKYGLGLSHVPTGFLNANRAYFKIAALAWNIKTWILNLSKAGNGAVLRFKRFLYKWIYQGAVVSHTGRDGVILRIDEGEYFYRFTRAMSEIANL
jgi:hypothetical protein